MKMKLLLGILVFFKMNCALSQNFFYEVKSGFSQIKKEGEYGQLVSKKPFEIPLDIVIGGGSKNIQFGIEYTSQIVPERYVYKDEFDFPRAKEVFNNKVLGGFLRYSTLTDIKQRTNFIFLVGVGKINFSKDVLTYETENLNSSIEGKPSFIYNGETGISILLFSGARLFLGGQVKFYNHNIPIAEDLEIKDEVISLSFKTGLSYNFNFRKKI